MRFMNSVFWKTVRLARWRWSLDLLLNITFFALVVLGILIANNIVSNIGVMQTLDMREQIILGLTESTQEEMEKMTAQFTSVIGTLIILIIALLFYCLLSYSMTEFFVYKNIYLKKLRRWTFWKYILFNLAAAPLLAALIIYLLTLMKEKAMIVFFAMFLLAWIYFFTFFNLIFFKEEKVFKSIKSLYLLTITKLHRLTAAFGWIILALIIPYTIVYLISLLWYGIIWIIPVIFLLWIMFNRHYLKNVLESKNIKDIFKD